MTTSPDEGFVIRYLFDSAFLTGSECLLAHMADLADESEIARDGGARSGHGVGYPIAPQAGTPVHMCHGD